ncbi:MAG: hypothetical protein AAF570_16980 [Bacteroidota bacterium]
MKADLIDGYGIRLRRVQAADLEQVRMWRNAEHVRANMEFQTEISQEAQESWFSKLDLERNFYWVASQAEVDFGVLHV